MSWIQQKLSRGTSPTSKFDCVKKRVKSRNNSIWSLVRLHGKCEKAMLFLSLLVIDGAATPMIWPTIGDALVECRRVRE